MFQVLWWHCSLESGIPLLRCSCPNAEVHGFLKQGSLKTRSVLLGWRCSPNSARKWVELYSWYFNEWKDMKLETLPLLSVRGTKPVANVQIGVKLFDLLSILSRSLRTMAIASNTSIDLLSPSSASFSSLSTDSTFWNTPSEKEPHAGRKFQSIYLQSLSYSNSSHSTLLGAWQDSSHTDFSGCKYLCPPNLNLTEQAQLRLTERSLRITSLLDSTLPLFICPANDVSLTNSICSKLASLVNARRILVILPNSMASRLSSW